ncbi:hypothetical protein J2X36_000829 [Methylobacterium sp. BE186]|uniref:hypothetical protein n=1 Tax=Methylobacterium sp. BE186 TaxID=2817715 RepID=UPI0028585039|nr:hypothetical protein [Methylobacterium sp. BE186]MDR7036093.1 hypothetical protein [Methylobacterium sp. BE186]
MTNNNVAITSLNKTRSTEWLLAFVAIAWGYGVLSPSAVFELPAYRLFGELMRETAWGALAVSIACLRLVGLAINGWWRRSPLIRAVGSLLSGLFWLALCVLMFAASAKKGATLPAGVHFYPVFFVFEGWCLAAAGYDVQKNGSLGRA